MARVASKMLGLLGEEAAVAFLTRRRVHVVGSNVFVARDEIDIIYRSDDGLTAVEVKTVTGIADPFEAPTDEKIRRLRRAIAGYERPIVALDAIGVTIGRPGAEIRWLRAIG